jgi:hypothetical protein
LCANLQKDGEVLQKKMINQENQGLMGLSSQALESSENPKY